MLGIDLYKEVLLNGEKYEGKVYMSEDEKFYYVDACVDTYAIFKKGATCSVINMKTHEDGCTGIDNFMLTKLKEVKSEIEMSWQECFIKYIENPDKYYMKAIDEHGVELKVSNKNELSLGYARPLTINFIRTSKWFLCER